MNVRSSEVAYLLSLVTGTNTVIVMGSDVGVTCLFVCKT